MHIRVLWTPDVQPKTNSQPPTELAKGRAPMSEAEAFNAYSTHVAGCRSCMPSSSRLCDEGVTLHEIWRREAAALPAVKARPMRAKVRR